MTTVIPVARPILGDDERSAVDRVIAGGGLAQGPEVASFESEFSRLVAGTKCIAVNSGTSALHLALIAMGVVPGDEVIVPSFTFAASANSIRLAGASPVFVDIDHDSFCIAPLAVESAVTPRTKAVMPVHLYGHPADMERIGKIADRHGLMVIEDAAQAHGASLHGRPVGSFGETAAFSFYPTKNMTSAEGGMVSTPSDDIARTVRLLRNQGMERRYENEIVGFNVRMSDVHAAIGRVQLKKLADWNASRQRLAGEYSAALRGHVEVPEVAPGAVHVFHQYTIRVSNDRDRFARALFEEYGVGTGVYYPIPVHRLPSFGMGGDLPETETAAREVISLPVHPSVSVDDRDRVIEAVQALARAGA